MQLSMCLCAVSATDVLRIDRASIRVERDDDDIAVLIISAMYLANAFKDLPRSIGST